LTLEYEKLMAKSDHLRWSAAWRHRRHRSAARRAERAGGSIEATLTHPTKNINVHAPIEFSESTGDAKRARDGCSVVATNRKTKRASNRRIA
jgi:hypothetical protein